ncbi:hypothetical protein DESC_190010 [Desulfosarcina cetonica]|nr:hypothetical protein DESC_190010 [Desulfosarcina cetonica]
MAAQILEKRSADQHAGQHQYAQIEPYLNAIKTEIVVGHKKRRDTADRYPQHQDRPNADGGDPLKLIHCRPSPYFLLAEAF